MSSPNQRKARPVPKPIGALDKLWLHEAGRAFAMQDVTNPERALLRHIAEEADLVAGFGRCAHRGRVCWILVPLDQAQFDLLAAFESDDREAEEMTDGGDDREDEHQTPSVTGGAPDWHPELFDPERIVPIRR